MRSQRSVDRPGRPTIVVGPHVFNDSIPACPFDPGAKLRSNLAKHRLDRQDHSRPQLQATAAAAVVVDLRILVHAPPDAVSDEVPDDMEPVLFGMLLNRGTDIAEVPAGSHLIDGQVETFAGRVDQLLRPGGDFAHRHGDGAVADEPVEDRTEIEADDVALLHPGAARNAMNDHVIDRGADDGRIRRQAHRSVAFERRFRAAPGQLFFSHGIELRRRGPGLDHRAHHLEDLENDAIGPIHHRDFLAVLENRTFHSIEHVRTGTSLYVQRPGRQDQPRRLRAVNS